MSFQTRKIYISFFFVDILDDNRDACDCPIDCIVNCTVKIQKSMKSIVRIVHLPSVVQSEFNEATRTLYSTIRLLWFSVVPFWRIPAGYKQRSLFCVLLFWTLTVQFTMQSIGQSQASRFSSNISLIVFRRRTKFLWGWVINDEIFILGWSNPLSCWFSTKKTPKTLLRSSEKTSTMSQTVLKIPKSTIKIQRSKNRTNDLSCSPHALYSSILLLKDNCSTHDNLCPKAF